VYTTRREDKWVHGSCLDVFSAHYWPDEAPPRGSDAGDDNDRGEDAANPSSRVSRPTRRARRWLPPPTTARRRRRPTTANPLAGPSPAVSHPRTLRLPAPISAAGTTGPGHRKGGSGKPGPRRLGLLIRRWARR